MTNALILQLLEGDAAGPEPSRLRSDLAPNRLGNCLQFSHKLGENLRLEGLRSIGQCPIRMWVYFDDKPIRAGSNAGFGRCANKIPLSSRMTGIDEHGQVGQLLENGHRINVECVSGCCFEGSDASLTNYYFVVAIR